MKRGISKGVTIGIIVLAVLLVAGGFLFFFEKDLILGIISPGAGGGAGGVFLQIELTTYSSLNPQNSTQIPNIEIRLWKNITQETTLPFKTAVTNIEGIADFGNMPEGNYYITYKKETFPKNLYYSTTPTLIEVKKENGKGGTAEKPIKKVIGIYIL